MYRNSASGSLQESKADAGKPACQHPRGRHTQTSSAWRGDTPCGPREYHPSKRNSLPRHVRPVPRKSIPYIKCLHSIALSFGGILGADSRSGLGRQAGMQGGREECTVKNSRRRPP